MRQNASGEPDERSGCACCTESAGVSGVANVDTEDLAARGAGVRGIETSVDDLDVGHTQETLDVLVECGNTRHECVGDKFRLMGNAPTAVGFDDGAEDAPHEALRRAGGVVVADGVVLVDVNGSLRKKRSGSGHRVESGGDHAHDVTRHVQDRGAVGRLQIGLDTADARTGDGVELGVVRKRGGHRLVDDRAVLVKVLVVADDALGHGAEVLAEERADAEHLVARRVLQTVAKLEVRMALLDLGLVGIVAVGDAKDGDVTGTVDADKACLVDEALVAAVDVEDVHEDLVDRCDIVDRTGRDTQTGHGRGQNHEVGRADDEMATGDEETVALVLDGAVNGTEVGLADHVHDGALVVAVDLGGVPLGVLAARLDLGLTRLAERLAREAAVGRLRAAAR